MTTIKKDIKTMKAPDPKEPPPFDQTLFNQQAFNAVQELGARVQRLEGGGAHMTLEQVQALSDSLEKIAIAAPDQLWKIDMNGSLHGDPKPPELPMPAPPTVQ